MGLEQQLMHEQDSTPLKKGSSLMDYLFKR